MKYNQARSGQPRQRDRHARIVMKWGKYMQEQLTKIITHSERTIIFITHSVDEALYLSDRVVMLSKRPATIKEIIDVPWDRPRDRASPEFTALRKRILSELEKENVMQ